MPKGVLESLMVPVAVVLEGCCDADGNATRFTATSTARTVGKAKVIDFDWSGRQAWDYGRPPATMALTRKGLYLFSDALDPKALGKALKKAPTLKLPLSEIPVKSRKDGLYVTVAGGEVCFGYGPAKGEAYCGDVCDASMCVTAEGLTSLRGAWSPNVSSDWTRVGGTSARSTVATSDELTGAQRALAEFRALRDRGCACQDVACGNQVVIDAAALGDLYAGTMSNPAELAALEAMLDELGACLSKLH